MTQSKLATTMMRGALALGALAAFNFASTGAAFAQAYPARPITLIVPWAPAGAGDNLGRLAAEILSKRLNQSVVVENHAGASESIGMALLVKAKPDGYTIGEITSASALNPSVMKVPYDVTKDVSYITQAISYGFVLLANPSLKVNTLGELIALAKSKPDGLNAGSGGQTSTLIFTALSNATGAKFTLVNYPGSTPSRTAVMGDQVQLHIDLLPPVEQLVKAGRLKALGLTSPRDKWLDTPLIAQTVPNFDFTGWMGFVAPVGTPPAVIETLNKELRAGLTAPEVRDDQAKKGINITVGTPAEFAAYMRKELDMNARLAKLAGIQVQ